jgi:oxalate decarboxylase
MLYGSARITEIDLEGRSFVCDVFEGDLWYFPAGIPHSIQGLGPDGAEFLLVFDDGNFSEHETVLLSDIMAHTPREIVSKNFGVEENSLKEIPREELFIFQAPVPGPLPQDQEVAAGTLVPSLLDFSFRPAQQSSSKEIEGGEVVIVDSSTCHTTSATQATRTCGLSKSSGRAVSRIFLFPSGCRIRHRSS